MRSPRLLLPLAAVLVAASLTAAGTSGAAGGFQTKNYNVTFSGTVKTEWNVPKYMANHTCYDTYWTEGSGSETWTVRSQQQKVLAYKLGSTPWLQVGSWKLGALLKEGSGLKAKGEHTRVGGYTHTATAGTCGLGPQVGTTYSGGDCGTRLANYQIMLNLNRGELTPDVMLSDNPIREHLVFDTCRLETPPNVVGGTWPAAPAKVKVKQLLGAKRAFTLTGHEGWKGEVPLPNRGTTATTIDWRMTFAPAGNKRR